MDFTPQELDLIYSGLIYLEDGASLTIGEEEVLKDLSKKILYKLSESE